MRFGSKPDTGFEHDDGSWALIIEIKGSRNFLVVGVVTKTMRERLGEMRMERHFEIDELRDPGAWEEFMNEIFHHSLRIAPEIGVRRDLS